MNKKYNITDWELWVRLCKEANLNPHETIDFGKDLGGGDCIMFIYCGEYPEEMLDEGA